MFSKLKRVLWKVSLLTTIICLVGVTIALAASGDLDTTFSGDGKQTTDFSKGFQDSMVGLALQSDGKIVAVGGRFDVPAITTGDFAIARYNPNGTLDTTFSGDGKQLTDFGYSGTEDAFDVAIQPSDGKIVVSGYTCSDLDITCGIAVARYNTNGSLDATFNSTGKEVLDFGKGYSQGGLAIQPDGKIVVAGYITNNSGDGDFFVYRLNSNGRLDTAFSGDGKVNFNFGKGRQDTPWNLRLKGNKIVVAGNTCDANGINCNFALARLNSNGSLDTTFSGDGKQTTNLGANESLFGLDIQTDGKIIVAGRKDTGSARYFVVARYNTNGSLDTTFNGTGKKLVNFGAKACAWDVLIQADGKIVAAGLMNNGTNYDFALTRLNANGSLDTTFSGDGMVNIDFGGNDDFARAVVRQGDGKYVLGGQTTKIFSTPDFALARIMH